MTGGWRERARREKERIRKQKERERKRRKEKKEVKGAPVSAMLELAQTNKQKRSAVRHYNIHHVPGKALTFEDRQLLAADWNRMVKAGRKPSLRKFARDHGLPYPTWRREYGRGMTGETVPDPRNSSRRTYAEYDAGVAQDKVNQSVANRGPKMKFTNQIDSRFTYWVKDRRLSPYDARFHLVEEFGEGKVPCTRTLYNHIENGDCGVHHGETPYHPSMKRRAKARAHPAKTCPEHLSIKDRPKAADERSEAGHFEMDTVVSRLGGAGGLLVAIDRMTREYFIELVDHIGQEDIAAALARMKARGALAGIRSMSTTMDASSWTRRRSRRCSDARSTTQGHTPPTKRDPSRTATASCEGGIPRAPTSRHADAPTSRVSKEPSTAYIASRSAASPRPSTRRRSRGRWYEGQGLHPAPPGAL